MGRSAGRSDALEVEPKDRFNEAQVIPGLQFFKVDGTDLSTPNRVEVTKEAQPEDFRG
jgi:hypothetical protein